MSDVSTGCEATGIGAGSVTITATVTKGRETVNVGAQLTVIAFNFSLQALTSITTVGVGESADVNFSIEYQDPVPEGLTLEWECATGNSDIATVDDEVLHTGMTPAQAVACHVTGIASGMTDVSVTVSIAGVQRQSSTSVRVGSGHMVRPAVIGDTVVVTADSFFNGVGTLQFVLRDVTTEPNADARYLTATVEIETTLISARRFFTRPISYLNWASWSLLQSGEECFYGYDHTERRARELPVAVGSKWTETVVVLIPADASGSAVELLVYQGPIPEFTHIGNCFGRDRDFNTQRSGETWFLLRGDMENLS